MELPKWKVLSSKIERGVVFLKSIAAWLIQAIIVWLIGPIQVELRLTFRYSSSETVRKQNTEQKKDTHLP